MMLKERYTIICNEYLQKFCVKQGFDYEPEYAWVAGNAGGCANVGDFYFSFDEIRYDIDNDIPKGKIIEWYNYCLETSMLDLPLRINYPSYCKGAPLPYNKEQIAKAQELKARMEQAEKEFREYVSETANNKG